MNVCSAFLPFSESQKHTFTYSLCTLCHVSDFKSLQHEFLFWNMVGLAYPYIIYKCISVSLFLELHLLFPSGAVAMHCSPIHALLFFLLGKLQRYSQGIVFVLPPNQPPMQTFFWLVMQSSPMFMGQEHVMKPQECLHGRLSSNLICSVFCLQVAPSEENRTEFLIKNVVSIKETII